MTAQPTGSTTKASTSAAPVRKTWPANPADVHEAVGRRAQEIYIRKGRVPGHDLENWVQAEAEILSEFSVPPPNRRAVVVRFEGVEYIGEYDLNFADGYTPGEFSAGAPVPIRFEGDKMFVKRPNGRQLETTIAKKIVSR
jgi:hypothetical protein